MPRAPFQCLIIPFMIENNVYKFAIFKRSNTNVWQFISGGGEDNETPLEAAKRECFEEAKIPNNADFYQLDTIASIAANVFSKKYRKNWGDDCYVIDEYTFAVKLVKDIISISYEHDEYKWVTYEEAEKMLEYDSNKTALTELIERIKNNNL